MKWSAGAAVFGGVVVAGLMAFGTPLSAAPNGSIFPQCPGDSNGDAIPDSPNTGPGVAFWNGARVRFEGGPSLATRRYYIDRTPPFGSRQPATEGIVHCMHLAGGDGFVTMADGNPVYTFGFSDVTGLLPDQVVNGNATRPGGLAAATYPAPTIELTEGEEFFLSLTNVGMIMRPDLFDQHSVHFHGFPNAASVFDGVPESSATVNMGSTFTYYYNIVDGLAGTYMYHCHVEATEHIQMGMVGNLYIHPRRTSPSGPTPTLDASTAFDVEYPIQLGSLDRNFHDQHIAIQPLPFAAMDDKHALLNGRGYPDTVDAGPIYHRRRVRQPAVAAHELTDRGHGGPEGAAAPLESRGHALLHDRVDDSDAGHRPERPAASRARRQEPVLQDQLPHPRRRRILRRHSRHRGSGAGHLPPLHDEPQLPEQRP